LISATAPTRVEDSVKQATAARPNKVASHSIAIFAVQVLVLFCGVGNNFLIARMGGPDGKGILYSLQLISIILGLSFLHFCLGSAAIVFLRQNRGTRQDIASGIFLPSVVLGIIPALVMGLSWHWTAHFITSRIAGEYFWLGLMAIPAMVLTYNVSYFCLGDDRLNDYNRLMAAPSILLSVILIALWLLQKTEVSFLIIAWCFSVFVPSFYAGFVVLRSAKGALLPRYSLFRKMYQFGWRAHLCGALQQLQHRSPVLLVAALLPVAQLGIYSLAITLVELLWYIPNTLSVALLPHVASSSEEEASRFTPAICRVTLAVTSVLGILLAVACSIVVPRVLPRFSPCLTPLWILMPGLAFASISRVMASDLNGRDKPMKVFYPVLTAVVLETVLGVYSVPRYALLGAASVTVLGYAVNTLMQIPIYCRVAAVPARSVLLIRRHDIAAIIRAVKSHAERFRELVTPEYGEPSLP
jgi:O-antigen/teichoic acid export membrane protein